MDYSWLEEFLRLTGGQPSEEILWNDTSQGPVIFGLVSDVFHCCTVDVEEFDADSLPLLRKTRDDLLAAGDKDLEYLVTLYTARERGCRPQGAWYGACDVPESIVLLFNECGPHRPAEFGNPMVTPEE